MNCPNGHPLGEHQRFCGQCGAQIDVAPAPTSAPPGRKTRTWIALSVVALLLVAGGGTLALTARSAGSESPEVGTRPTASPTHTAGEADQDIGFPAAAQDSPDPTDRPAADPCAAYTDGHYSAQDSAQCLFSAWEAGGTEGVPPQMAGPHVVRTLLSGPMSPEGMRFSGCTDQGQDDIGFTTFRCEFKGGGASLQLYAHGTSSASYPITEIGFFGNPPGWEPVD